MFLFDLKRFQQISKASLRCNWVYIFTYYQTQDIGIWNNGIMEIMEFFPLMHIRFFHHNHLVFSENWFMKCIFKLDIVSVEILANIICVPVASKDCKNSHENIWARVSFSKSRRPPDCSFVKKHTPTQVFSCEFS